MYKRLSIRIVEELAKDLGSIAQKRGLSVNSLISEMAWDFVEDWKEKYENSGRGSKQGYNYPPDL